MYPRLRAYIIILNPIQQLGETPERVGLDRGEDGGGEVGGVEEFGVAVCASEVKCSDGRVSKGMVGKWRVRNRAYQYKSSRTLRRME